jgi:hypothetical protein
LNDVGGKSVVLVDLVEVRWLRDRIWLHVDPIVMFRLMFIVLCKDLVKLFLNGIGRLNAIGGMRGIALKPNGIGHLNGVTILDRLSRLNGIGRQA